MRIKFFGVVLFLMLETGYAPMVLPRKVLARSWLIGVTLSSVLFLSNCHDASILVILTLGEPATDVSILL